MYVCYLVGGLEHCLFAHILGTMIPTHQYCSEGLKPPTSYVVLCYVMLCCVVLCSVSYAMQCNLMSCHVMQCKYVCNVM